MAPRPSPESARAAVAERLDRLLGSAVRAVRATRDELFPAQALESARTSAPEQSRQEVLQDILTAHPDLDGLGTALASSEDGETGEVEWYVVDSGHTLRRFVETRPSVAGYVDFRTMEWFRRPLETGRVEVVGPYVDTLCNDQYTITTALPVRTPQARGVVVADLLVARLERELLPGMLGLAAALGRTVLLIDDERRVVVSTSSRLRCGVLIDDAEPSTPGSPTFRLIAGDGSGGYWEP